MLRVALTGNIGTGKTTVLRIFAREKIPAIDADKIVDALYRKKNTKEFLKKEFGTIEKEKISQIIFCDKKKRLEIEHFLHPSVMEEIEKFFSSKKNKKIAVAEVPLLFEAKLEKLFSKTIVVKATEPQQVFRLQKMGFSISEILPRMMAQLPLHEKAKRADFVIDNSGTFEETKKQVKKIIKKLKK